MFMVYTYNEVFKGAMEYFKGDTLATSVWINSYCLKDRDQNLLEDTPIQTWKRLAKEFGRIERNYGEVYTEEEILQFLINREIIPGGSSIYGIGNDFGLSSLGNCFVLGSKKDSYNSICKIDEEQVQLMKRRGGVGHDLSHLRPKGTAVNGAARTSTGAVSFAERYSKTTREVAQDGRRGALMLTMDVRHPDSDKFRDLKTDQTTCTGANISLKFTDSFMDAVKEKIGFLQSFPVDIEPLEDYFEVMQELKEGELTPVIDKYNGNFKLKKINANHFFTKFVENNHAWAEPGCLFWDRIMEYSIGKHYGESWIESSTNPCGELPLCPEDSCRLLSINYFTFVDNPFTKQASLNLEKLRKTVRAGQYMLDDIVDLEEEKINLILQTIRNESEKSSDPEEYTTEIRLWEKILDKLLQGRRTGLGPMGVADMIAALGLKYGTAEATKVMEEVQREVALASYMASIDMAEERGCFPMWNLGKEWENPFIQRIYSGLSENYQCLYELFGRRNLANLTCAPTGTTSIITQISSGIEPVFSLVYLRKTKLNANEEDQSFDSVDEVGDRWKHFIQVHPGLKMWYEVNRENLGPEITFTTLPKSEDMTVTDWEQITVFSPYHKATAEEIDYLEKVRLQGRLQKWVDHSISVTHNLPEDITVEEIKGIYLLAWEVGCKGCTIYRSGSRSGVIVKLEDKFKYSKEIERPDTLFCDLHFLTSLKEEWLVLIGKYEDKPYEVFAVPARNISTLELIKAWKAKGSKFKVKRRKSKHYSLTSENEGDTFIGDILPLMEEDDKTETKRFSLMLRFAIPLTNIVETVTNIDSEITSFQKAISRVLKKYIKENELSGSKCEKCGGKMEYKGGCPVCRDCGYTRCS